MRVIGNFILGMIAISTWCGCERSTTKTTNHQICSIYGDRRTITDTIYLYDNGRHVDVIVYEKDGKYTGYGWGTKEFYLQVPTWDDSTYRAVYNATDKDNEVLMHVKEDLVRMEDWVEIPITKEQWNDLSENIRSSFKLDTNGSIIFVADGYESSDSFYEAHGSYSLEYTCNSWANDMLKNSGIYARKHAIFSREVISIHRK